MFASRASGHCVSLPRGVGLAGAVPSDAEKTGGALARPNVSQLPLHRLCRALRPGVRALHVHGGFFRAAFVRNRAPFEISARVRASVLVRGPAARPRCGQILPNRGVEDAMADGTIGGRGLLFASARTAHGGGALLGKVSYPLSVDTAGSGRGQNPVVLHDDTGYAIPPGTPPCA